MQKISVFIIAYNEEKIIEKCLKKLSWANEIIVVDSGSTDKTIRICEKLGAKVIYNKFENFGKQKQFALNQTTNNWVLSLDADEVLSDELISEIKNIDFSCNGYLIPRTHVFCIKFLNQVAKTRSQFFGFLIKNRGNLSKTKCMKLLQLMGKLGCLKTKCFILLFSIYRLRFKNKLNIHY